METDSLWVSVRSLVLSVQRQQALIAWNRRYLQVNAKKCCCLKRTLISLLLFAPAWARTELEDSYTSPSFSPDRKSVAYERHFLSNLGRIDQVWRSDLRNGNSRLLCEYPAIYGDHRDRHLLGWTANGEIVVRAGRPVTRSAQSSDSLSFYPASGPPRIWPSKTLQRCAFYALSGEKLLSGRDLGAPNLYINGYPDEIPGKIEILDLKGEALLEVPWPNSSRPLRPTLSPNGRWIVDLENGDILALPTSGGKPIYHRGSWEHWCWRGQELLLRQRDGELLKWDPVASKSRPLTRLKGSFSYIEPRTAYVRGRKIVGGTLESEPRLLRKVAQGTPLALAWLPASNQLLYTVTPEFKETARILPSAQLFLNHTRLSAGHHQLAAQTPPLAAGQGLQSEDRNQLIPAAQIEKEVKAAFIARFDEECYYTGARVAQIDGAWLALAVGPTGMGSTPIWATFQRRAGGWECLGQQHIMGEEVRPPQGFELELLGLHRLPARALQLLIPRQPLAK